MKDSDIPKPDNNYQESQNGIKNIISSPGRKSLNSLHRNIAKDPYFPHLISSSGQEPIHFNKSNKYSSEIKSILSEDNNDFSSERFSSNHSSVPGKSAEVYSVDIRTNQNSKESTSDMSGKNPTTSPNQNLTSHSVTQGSSKTSRDQSIGNTSLCDSLKKKNNLQHEEIILGKPISASPADSNIGNRSYRSKRSSISIKNPAINGCDGSIIPNKNISKPVSSSPTDSTITTWGDLQHESTMYGNLITQQHGSITSGYKRTTASPKSVSNVTIMSNQRNGVNISNNKPRASPSGSNMTNRSSVKQGIMILDDSGYAAPVNTHGGSSISKNRNNQVPNSLTSNITLAMSSAQSKEKQLTPLGNWSQNFSVSNNPSFASNVRNCNPYKTKPTCPSHSRNDTPTFVEIEPKHTAIQTVIENTIKIKKKFVCKMHEGLKHIKRFAPTTRTKKRSCPNVGPCNKTPGKTKWSCPNVAPCNKMPFRMNSKWFSTKRTELAKECNSSSEMRHKSPNSNWSCPSGACNKPQNIDSKLCVMIEFLKKIKKCIACRIHKGLIVIENIGGTRSADARQMANKECKRPKTKWSCPEAGPCNEAPIIMKQKRTLLQKILARVKKIKKFTVRRVKRAYRKGKVLNAALYASVQENIPKVRRKLKKIEDIIKGVKFNKLKKSPSVEPAIPPTASSDIPQPAENLLSDAINPPTGAELQPVDAPLQGADAGLQLPDARLQPTDAGLQPTDFGLQPTDAELQPEVTKPPKFKKQTLKEKLAAMMNQMRSEAQETEKENEEPEPKISEEIKESNKPKTAEAAKVKKEQKSTLHEGYRSEQFVRDREWFKREYLRHIGSPQKEFRSEFGLEKSVLSELKGQRLQCITEVMLYRKQVLHGPHAVNVDFRNKPLATRCVCPERNCTCYLKRSAISYRKFFMPYAIPTHYPKKWLSYLLPCLPVLHGNRSLVPKLVTKHKQESDFYKSPKGIKMLKLGGPQFCLYSCKGYFMAGRTFVIRRGGRGAKVVFPKKQKKKKDIPMEPIDTNITICDYYHCTVSTQTTFTPKGELIYGEVVRTIYGAIGEGVFKDLSGTKLEVSAYKHEPPTTCVVNMDNILHYNVIKQRLSKWKCGLYTSIRKCGVCLREGFSENPHEPDYSSEFSTVSIKSYDDSTTKSLKPCRSLRKSKAKKSSVSFGDVLDKDMDMKELVGCGKNRAITIKEIIGDGVDDCRTREILSGSKDEFVNSSENIEKKDVPVEAENNVTKPLRLEKEIQQTKECLLTTLSKIKYDIFKWIFQPESDTMLHSLGYEYSLGSCAAAGENKGSGEIVTCPRICPLVIAENQQKDVRASIQESTHQVAIDNKKEDVINSSTRETTPVEPPIKQEVESAIPSQPPDFGSSPPQPEKMLTYEEYIDRTLCKPRSDGTCGPLIKEKPLCQIICPRCNSYKLDTRLYEISSDKHGNLILPDSDITTSAITVDNKQEYIIIKSDTKISTPTTAAENMQDIAIKTKIDEKKIANKPVPIAKDAELSTPPKPLDFTTSIEPQVENKLSKEEYIDGTLCRPRSDETCGPMIKEKPLCQIICPHCKSFKVDTGLYETITAKKNEFKPDTELTMPLVNDDDRQENTIQTNSPDLTPPSSPETQLVDDKTKSQAPIENETKAETPALPTELGGVEMLTKTVCPDCQSYEVDAGYTADTTDNIDEQTPNTFQKITLETDNYVNKIEEILEPSDDKVCCNNKTPSESDEKTESQENKYTNEAPTDVTCSKKAEANQDVIKVSVKDVPETDLERNDCETNVLCIKPNENKTENSTKTSLPNKLHETTKNLSKNVCGYDGKGFTLLTFNDTHRPAGSRNNFEATTPSIDKKSDFIINKLWHVDKNELSEQRHSKTSNKSKKVTLSDMLKKLRGLKIDAKTSVQSKDSNKPSEVVIEKTSYEQYDEIMKKGSTHDIITMTDMSVEHIEIRSSRESEINNKELITDQMTDQHGNSDDTIPVTIKKSEPRKSQKPEMSRYRYYF